MKKYFKKITNHKYIGLLFSTIYLVAILLIGLTLHKLPDEVVGTDFLGGFVSQAESFIKTGVIEIDNFRGPLYPIVLGIVNLLFNNYLITGTLIAAISSAISLGFNYSTIKKVFDKNIAFFSIILISLNPFYIKYSYEAGTDMFFVAIASALLFFVIKWDKYNFKRIISLAFLASLGYLTRSTGIFLYLITSIWILNISKDNLKQIFKPLIFFFISIFIITLPWNLYTLSETGNFIHNRNHLNLAFELYGKDNTSWDEFWYKNGEEFGSGEASNYNSFSSVILKDPIKFSTKIVSNSIEHSYKDLSILVNPLIGFFFLVGIIALYKNKTNKIYILNNLLLFTILLTTFYSPRFSLFLIPFYISLALFGIKYLNTFFEEKYSKSRFQKAILLSLVTILVLSSLLQAIEYNRSQFLREQTEVYQIKEKVFDNIPAEYKGTKIATRRPHLPYVLNMESYTIPNFSTIEELIQDLQDHEIDYLYYGIDEWKSRPQYTDLKLSAPLGYAPEGLELIYTTGEPGYFVFRVHYEERMMNVPGLS